MIVGVDFAEGKNVFERLSAQNCSLPASNSGSFRLLGLAEPEHPRDVIRGGRENPLGTNFPHSPPAKLAHASLLLEDPEYRLDDGFPPGVTTPRGRSSQAVA